MSNLDDSENRREAFLAVGEALAAFVGAVPARMRRAVAEAHQKMDPAGLPLLRGIGSWGPLRLTELAERLGLDASTVSRLVRDLERRGLIHRTADSADQRASLLALAPGGRRLLSIGRAAHRRLLEEALADWPTEDIQTLGSLLSRFAGAVREVS